MCVLQEPPKPRRGKRDFISLERRRHRAATLLGKGRSQAEVARLTGVSRQSVSRWARAIAKDGLPGLRRAERVGRKPRLTALQLNELTRLLRAGAKASGFPNDRWTGPRVAKVVEKRFRIVYRRTRALDLLRALE